jgi:oligopeptide/dipeptide ABC transporter ATP-binding protein
MALLEVENLKKHFHFRPDFLSKLLGGKGERVIKAVDGVSFTLQPGEILGVAGESGCGKSTTSMMIAQLVNKTSGSIRYRGQEVSELDQKGLQDYRRKVQVIFQDPYQSLNPRFNVFDLVAEPLRALTTMSKAEIRERVMKTIDMVGLKAVDYVERFPHQMSGGERQRVGIACALVLEPELVVADEPVSMLDVSIRAGLLDLIRDLSARLNFSCIFISHDLAILSNITDRIAIMYLGKIMEIGKTHDVIFNPHHPYANALISAVAVPDPAYKRSKPDIRGEVSQPIDPPPGCRFQLRCPKVMPICLQDEPPLLEVEPDHLASCHLFSGKTAAP